MRRLTHTPARLHSNRERESGFYTGLIEAVDIENHKYWVTFDRPGLGKHPVPDNEIRVSQTTDGCAYATCIYVFYKAQNY